MIRAKHNRGFSLTELMIVVAILTILGAVAMPSFTNHVRRSNRADATAALLRMAAEQEKFYLQNNTYADEVADLGDPSTQSGYYTLSVTAGNAATFTIVATPAAGGPQANDGTCSRFLINANGQRTAENSVGEDTSDVCW